MGDGASELQEDRVHGEDGELRPSDCVGLAPGTVQLDDSPLLDCPD